MEACPLPMSGRWGSSRLQALSLNDDVPQRPESHAEKQQRQRSSPGERRISFTLRHSKIDARSKGHGQGEYQAAMPYQHHRPPRGLSSTFVDPRGAQVDGYVRDNF